MENNTNTALSLNGMVQADFVKRIGKTTYMVNVHFSTTSKETMSDKIMRLVQNDIRSTESNA